MRRDKRVCVVLWRGMYCNDGRERLDTLKRNERTLFGLSNARLVGSSGNWRVVADAALDVPREDDQDGSVSIYERVREG